MPKHYPPEQRERAVRMILDHLDEYRSVYSACQAIGPKLGIGAESLRNFGQVTHGQFRDIDAALYASVVMSGMSEVPALLGERDAEHIEVFVQQWSSLYVHAIAATDTDSGGDRK
ncbi:hypothetical protein [Rhodococcus baikonurensis]|uniref:Transposase n=1 Tax=Rhodococcus baikonurensis TaxID=172041 RepID=A0ABV5XK63_9NOCA